jgi:DNA polymerase I-like protein with 3'-5' exonuclease and polymerase domains
VKLLPEFLENLDPGIYFSDSYVVLDFEVDTSHGDYGNPVHPDNHLLFSGWKLGPTHPDACPLGTNKTYGQWGNEFDNWDRFLAHLESADFIVGHNAKYELGWLRRMGADLRRLLPFDTRLAEYVLLGNLAAGSDKLGMPKLSTSLDMACRRRGLPIKDPVVDLLMHHGINPVRLPRRWLSDRCRQDVETTEALFLHQRADLQARGLLPVLYTRCLLTPVLADIEPEGLQLDADAVKAEYEKAKAEFAALSSKMDQLTGGINWRSSVQVASFIYDTLKFEEIKDFKGRPKRTSSGKRQTSAKVLDKLEAKNRRQKEFLSLRKELGRVAALLSKNLEYFMGVVNDHGGKFYAELHQANTATHRLASTGIPLRFPSILDDSGNPVKRTVQIQNIPRGFKRLFKAKREGWYFAEPDGSSLEFRVACELGGPDRAALEDIETGWDPHVFTASVLFEATIAEVKAQKIEAEEKGEDDWRQLAKPDTFKPLYGGTTGTPEQEKYYAAFRERYPGVAAVQESWVNEALEDKQLVTPWGLVYHFPTAKRYAYGNSSNVQSVVFNYPIQALATAEIIPIALVYLWHRIRERGLEEKVYIVNTVHDSAPCEVEPSAAVPFVELVKQCFTRDVYSYLQAVYGLDFKTPLGVGIKMGYRWGSGEGTEALYGKKEIQFNIWKDGREQRVK